jgi:hypothetical protein
MVEYDFFKKFQVLAGSCAFQVDISSDVEYLIRLICS